MEIIKSAKRTYSIRQYEPFDIFASVKLTHDDLPVNNLSLEEQYNVLNETIDVMLEDMMKSQFDMAVEKLQEVMQKFPVSK